MDEQTNPHRWVGRKRDERTNGKTHIGGRVEKVTNGQMHSKNGDGRMHRRTNGKLFSKAGWYCTHVLKAWCNLPGLSVLFDPLKQCAL